MVSSTPRTSSSLSQSRFSVNIQLPKLGILTYVFSVRSIDNLDAVCYSKLKDGRLLHAVEVLIEFDPGNRLGEVWVPTNSLEEAPKIPGLLRAVDQWAVCGDPEEREVRMRL
jgi:hypothetical protein